MYLALPHINNLPPISFYYINSEYYSHLWLFVYVYPPRLSAFWLCCSVATSSPFGKASPSCARITVPYPAFSLLTVLSVLSSTTYHFILLPLNFPIFLLILPLSKKQSHNHHSSKPPQLQYHPHFATYNYRARRFTNQNNNPLLNFLWKLKDHVLQIWDRIVGHGFGETIEYSGSNCRQTQNSACFMGIHCETEPALFGY